MRTCFYLDRRTCFLLRQENMRFGWACPTLDACVSSLKPLDFSLFTFHSSLKLLDTSLFVLHSSLKPLDFSLFTLHLNYWILHFSFFTLPLNHWIFHFSLFTFHFHYGSPSHLTIISTSLVDSHLTFFLYPCSTSAWCSSGQRLTHIISRFTATCGSVEGK